MDSIDILINEHVHIRKVLSAVRNDCENLAHGSHVDVKFYRDVIDFVRNFADKYHHRKEEKKLFNIMAEMDENIKNGPILGMLMEHDLGRYYIKSLETSLDEYEKGDAGKKAYIIANALSYVLMLEKHIEKEDTAIYMTARRLLGSDVLKRLTEEFNEIEDDIENTAIRKRYVDFAGSLQLPE